jgi:hypothetical protein
MNEIQHGLIRVILPIGVELIEKAGDLDQVAVSRIVKPPSGLSEACRHAADSLEKTQGQFITIEGISPQTLREEAQQIEKLEQVIQDLEIVLSWAKRTNLVQKAGTYAKLCQLNEFVKAYAMHDALYNKIFKAVRDFFKKR